MIGQYKEGETEARPRNIIRHLIDQNIRRLT